MKRLLMMTAAVLVACGPATLDDSSLHSSNAALMPLPENISGYKAHLPNIAFPELDQILKSNETHWYDHNTIIPSYQDHDGDPMGMRDNSSGHTLSLARHFFNKKSWVFPFSQTAGTDDVEDLTVANFISLPKSNGQVVPIGYYFANQGNGSNGTKAYRWFFPVGTVIGEVIYVKSPEGELYVSEVRTRKRYKDNWATNVYRPFPTAAHLAAAIQKLRPNYESSASLSGIVSHLQNNATLTPTVLAPKLGSKPMGADNRYRGDQVVETIENRLSQVFTANGAVDTLPAFNDPQLVKELLTKTTFVSSYGQVWKRSGSVETYAASTQESFSIVPSNYKAGLIAVTEASCHRCHSFAGQDLKYFDSQTVAYGKLWGDDGIFSFQPFEASMFYSKTPNNLGSHVINFNNDNRRIRKDFTDKSIVKSINSPNDSPFYNDLPKAMVK